MNKFTCRETTEYALYRYMKNNVTDFDTIFSGNQIISAIMCRYELDGSFNSKVLDLMPSIGLSWVMSEEQLQEIVDRLTDDIIESEFVQISKVINGYHQVYYIKRTNIEE